MSARALTWFAAMSALWGIPYLFIKVAVDDGVPPAFLAWARVLMAVAMRFDPAERATGRRLVGLFVGMGGARPRRRARRSGPEPSVETSHVWS